MTIGGDTAGIVDRGQGAELAAAGIVLEQLLRVETTTVEILAGQVKVTRGGTDDVVECLQSRVIGMRLDADAVSAAGLDRVGLLVTKLGHVGNGVGSEGIQAGKAIATIGSRGSERFTAAWSSILVGIDINDPVLQACFSGIVDPVIVQVTENLALDLAGNQ